MAAAAAARDENDADEAVGTGGLQRLDKWLWFVRVIKTRTQAAALVTEGKVRVNKVRVEKPSQSLRPGDVVTVTVRGHIRVLKMVAPGVRRGPPVEARTLYEDLTPPEPPRSAGIASQGERAAGDGRPTKKERRQLDRFRGD